MVWQKLSRRDFGEANRQLDSGTLSGSSVKQSQMSWIVSGSSCWNTWTHMNYLLSWREEEMLLIPRRVRKTDDGCSSQNRGNISNKEIVMSF